MKTKKNKINDYKVVVGWNERDECFVAKVPAFPGLAAHGSTPENAVSEVRVALGAAIELLEEDGVEAPEADQTLEQVRAMLPLINISKLSKLSRINRQTLSSKLFRGTRFSTEEAQRIHRALDAILT